jgi:ribosome biogenesis GTPase YqeH
MKCEGCGIEIQSSDPKMAGYIPEEVLKEKIANNEKIVCQRCFKLKHYNYLMPIKVESDFSEELDKILVDFNTILWVVDVIDFEGTFRIEIAERLKGKNVILVVNKVDLLPKSTSYSQLKEWLINRLKSSSLNISVDNIVIASSKTGLGIGRIKKLLSQINEKKVLILGVTNVGKSSFLNKLTNKDATVSAFLGTTLKLLKTEIPDLGIEVYDTPGIFTNDRLCDFFDIFTQVKMVPSKKITTKTYTIAKGNVLFISSLFWVDILENGVRGLPPIMTVFLPEGISTHRAKRERTTELLYNRKVLYPPYDDKFDFEKVEFEKVKVKVDKGNDIAISGAGWVSIKRGPLIAEILKPKQLKFHIRQSMK